MYASPVLISTNRFAALRGGSEIDSLVEAQSLCQRNSTGLWAFPDAMPQDHSASDQADGNCFSDIHIDSILYFAGKEDSDTSPTNDELVLVKVSEIYDGSNFCVNVVSGVANEKFSDFQKSTEITELMKSHDSEVYSIRFTACRIGLYCVVLFGFRLEMQ